MHQFQALGRAVTMALLLFAVADLSSSASCVDVSDAAHAELAIGAAADSAPAGHRGDDCFCCSRTVRTTATFTVCARVVSLTAPDGFSPEPQPLVVRPVFHPPIA